MSKRKHFKPCAERLNATRRTPKYLLTAFGESPSNKCLTHIVDSPGPSKSSSDSKSSTSEPKDSPTD